MGEPIAGLVGPGLQRHWMRGRLKRGKREGYDTSHDTKEGALNMPAPEVIERMVGTWGLEPQTSTVSR